MNWTWLSKMRSPSATCSGPTVHMTRMLVLPLSDIVVSCSDARPVSASGCRQGWQLGRGRTRGGRVPTRCWGVVRADGALDEAGDRDGADGGRAADRAVGADEDSGRCRMGVVGVGDVAP